MKKRSSILALALTLVLSLGSVQGVFADTTIPGVDENTVDKWATQYANETIQGKYKVVDTETLYKWVSNPNEKMVIVDTMPAWSFDYQIAEKTDGKTADSANGHIPGAINQVVTMKTNGGMTSAEKTDLIKKVNAKLPYKTVTKTTWKKVTKKAYKKLKKANRKTKKVKGKTYYYKKVVTKSKVKDKSYKIVVYCGWVKCDRSHQGAAYLVKQGYTNVYRYGGGIDAWKDAGYEREGLKPADPEPGEVVTGAEKVADFSYDINLSGSEYEQDGNTARIWVPLPQSDDYQTISDVKVTAENASVNEAKEVAGNKYQYIEFAPETVAADRTATVSFHVVRKAIDSTKMSEFGDVPADIKADYVDATFETMGSDSDIEYIKKKAEEIVKNAGATTIEEKAKAIYDWEINNLYRREGDNGETEDGYLFGGCGRGEVYQVLAKTHGGKCTDLNSTYVALCRSVGVPAREKFGIRLDNSGSNKGKQHCRAEFYLPGTGWVEADPADALKTLRSKGLVYGVKTIKDMNAADVEAAMKAYWGANNNDWVKLAVGRDITLDPAQKAACPSDADWTRCLLNKSGKLNNLGYVYGEMVDADGNATYMDAYAEAKFGYDMHCTVQ